MHMLFPCIHSIDSMVHNNDSNKKNSSADRIKVLIKASNEMDRMEFLTGIAVNIKLQAV